MQRVASSTRRIPSSVPWGVARGAALLCCLGLMLTAFLQPHLALALLWGILIPSVPCVLVIAPGAWRNICPLATVGHIPVREKWTRAKTLPRRIRPALPIAGILLLVSIVALRHVLLDRSGPASAVLLAALLAAAFAGGMVFKGQSGWCASLCPLLQVERAYGQAPLVMVPMDRCGNCVGCVKGCYDANPRNVIFNDMRTGRLADTPERWLIAASLPWLILGFFTSSDQSTPSLAAYAWAYLHTIIFVGAGCLLFVILAISLKPNLFILSFLHLLVAFNLFYAFAAPAIAHTLRLDQTPATVLIRCGVFIVSLAWLLQAQSNRRAWLRRQPARQHASGGTQPIKSLRPGSRIPAAESTARSQH